MTIEPAGTGPSAPPSPSRTNPWVITAVIAFVLCCGCFGALGLLLAFGGDILKELGLTASLLIQTLH
jgi:hypothetical protein